MQYENQLRDILGFSPPYISKMKPSEWAEKYRVMTSDTSPYPGKFSYDNSPYAREIVDCLSPEHPARVIGIMKGAQIGISTGVLESGIGWIISQNPGNILLTARDERMIKKMVNSKIDPMIDTSGLRHLIRPNVIRKKNQRTGDTDQSKEFAGGSLLAMSIQTPEAARQFTAQYGFLDDFEAAKTSKSAGSPLELFETRFYGTHSKMKLFVISTPEIKQTSHIEPIYLRGDQRRYYIPCPCCGDFIHLDWTLEVNGVKCGMTWKLDKTGRIVKGSVGYVCQSCAGFFEDKHKTEFLRHGTWKPTATPQEEGYYSYHLSSLYSPAGMSTWENYANKYLQACPPNGKVDTDKYKTFTNTVLGLTWEERSKENDAKGILSNTREYGIGIVPNKTSIEDGNGRIVMITCGADIGGFVDDTRIDYEITAWAMNGTSYSIEHGSIGSFKSRKGDEGRNREDEKLTLELNQSNSAFTVFKNLLSKTLQSEDGNEYKILCTALDSSAYTTYAYAFVDSCPELIIVPIKGMDEKGYKITTEAPIFKKGYAHDKLYILDVDRIKDIVSDSMELKWDRMTDQQPGYMNFPEPSDGLYSFPTYFIHFEAEKRTVDPKKGVMWVKKNSSVQNHFFDCRIYNYAIRDIMSFMICKDVKLADRSFQAYVNYYFGSE